ncbi:PH domain-containing protein [Halomonas campisalis]|uniref:PH domain-containing protein n=1 Tax=Billgrantia campisalis TaxID=74661 RepID=A0ABS9P852_9GAMM|nr:PH domain-containing protein [Halomonas campisalis]MCG6657955.1 PH domain-containing protein [Halomonas campisalis]MDR5863520.1 PH domain-containing protein [Halomonas campisalis]
MNPPGPETADARLARWQRLSPWAVGLLLITSGLSLIRQHLPLLLGAGAGLALVERVGLRELALGGALLLLLAVLLSLLYYRRFRFRLEGEVLVIQKGLFEHREFKVSAAHVQHIAVHQPAYMRPFGVVQWQLETLAGEASRIELPGIRREIAEALGRRLRGASDAAQQAAAEDAGEADEAPRVRFAITPGALALHGLTSRSVYVVAAMLSPLVQPLERWVHDHLPHLDLRAWLPASAPLAVALGILAVVAALALLSVLAAWWRFHGYVLRDEGDRQVQVSGLFHRQEQVLTLSRLQVVEWVQTGLGRLLGRGYLVCHQFGALGGGEAAEARRFLVPGLSSAQGRELSAVLWPGLSMRQPLARVTRLYRRVLFWRLLLGLAAALLGLGALVGPASLAPMTWGLLAAGLLPLAAGLAQLRWLALGWAREGDYLRVRQGLWGQRTSLFPLRSLVSASVQQSWLQRRRGVATLRLHLANGRVTLPFLACDDAYALANRLLASVEADQAA